MVEKIKGDTVHIKHYHQNGKVSAISRSLNADPPKKIGWTTLYTKKGDLTGRLEYLDINDKEHLNRYLSYGKDGGIISDSSNYYKLKVSKLKNTDRYRFSVKYFPANRDADVVLVISKDFRDDFSNVRKVKSDSLFLENNEITTNDLKDPYREIKGFFYEYQAKVKNPVGKDSVKMSIYEKNLYFNELIKVSDTTK